MERLIIPIGRHGAFVDLIVGITTQHATARRAAALTPIVPLKMTAILDTGSETTVIPRAAVNQLELVPRGRAHLFQAFETEPQPAFKYDVSLAVLTAEERFLSLTGGIQIVGAPLDEAAYEAIVGRDVLRLLEMHYDGRRASAALHL